LISYIYKTQKLALAMARQDTHEGIKTMVRTLQAFASWKTYSSGTSNIPVCITP